MVKHKGVLRLFVYIITQLYFSCNFKWPSAKKVLWNKKERDVYINIIRKYKNHMAMN